MKFSYCTFLCFHQCSGSLNYDRLRIRIRILLLVITYGTEATGTLHQAAGTLHQSSNITRNHKTVEIKFFSMFFIVERRSRIRKYNSGSRRPNNWWILRDPEHWFPQKLSQRYSTASFFSSFNCYRIQNLGGQVIFWGTWRVNGSLAVSRWGMKPLSCGFFKFFYSTLFHLPPLRFHCVGGCWYRMHGSCDYGIGCQTLKPLG
jgi:hypothetical protein